MDERKTGSIGGLSILPPITVKVFKLESETDRELLLQFECDGPLPDMQETVCLGREVSDLFSE